MTELEKKAEIRCDLLEIENCEYTTFWLDGYKQGQKDEKEKPCDYECSLVKSLQESLDESYDRELELKKENEELKNELFGKNEQLEKSIAEKNLEVEELKKELKNYANVINELMGVQLTDTEEVGRLIEIAHYRNWNEL